MEEKKKRNKLTIALVVIGILLIVGIVVGLSYAYWTYTASQKTINKITSDCIEVTITDETDAINLDKTYPISDAEAENLSPYTFKVTNTCNMAASYSINLEVMDVTDRLSSNYVAVSFNGGAKSILSSNTSVDPTYDEDDYTAIEAYNLGSGELAGGKSESYTLKLWIDGSATNNDSMEKTFISKITVTTGIAPKGVLCKRATALHSLGASNVGSIGTTGTLTAGDAFDCDVNGDGTYDAETERFYYVSDYYDTETKEFDTSYSTLIYYNNVSGGVANDSAAYAYNTDESAHLGPQTAMLQLPTTSQWSNVSLKDVTRDITGNNSVTYLAGYNYSGYAARLLTYQEVDAGCNDGTTTLLTGNNSLTKCSFLFENTTDSLGYWLENTADNDYRYADYVNRAYYNISNSIRVTSTSNNGVRPVIDVAKSNMKY